MHHRVARDWLDRVEAPASVLFCRQTQLSFLRLLTNPAVLAPYGNPPLTNTAAWQAFEALLADDRVVLRTDEPVGFEPRWMAFAARETASPKLWMDAYLAAFAVTDRDRLVTTDGDFRQFDGLDLLLLGST